MRKMTKEEFVIKSNIIYDNLYDYSNVHYVNNKTMVEILCKVCNSYFNQTPNNHLLKNKIHCKCSNKLNTEVFIKRAKDLNGDLFNYKNVSYVDSYTKVEIICNNCGTFFWQIPNNHLRGNRCPICFGTHRKTTELFIKESMEIHKDKYDYSNVSYKNSRSKVEISCNNCGCKFSQSPIDHLRGHGCSCSNGFNYNAPSILYYVRIEIDGRFFYKIGVSNRTVSERFGREMNIITIIKVVNYNNGSEAYKDERYILEKNKKYKYTGDPILKSGNTEIFIKDVLNLDI